MKKKNLSCLSILKIFFWTAAIFSAASVFGKGEIVCESTVKSIGLFKNGLAVVQEEIEVPKPGRYILPNLPAPVHGTFFVESDAEVVVASSLRDTEIPIGKSDPCSLDDLAGKKVIVHLSGDKTITGELLTRNKNISDQIDLSRSDYSGYPVYRNVPSFNDGIVLKKESGEIVVFPNKNNIVEIETAAGEKISSVTRKVPTLVFDVRETPECQGTIKIQISFLVYGLTWAPSCRFNLLDDKTMRIEQVALLINQWRDLSNTEVFVISGFPKISFARTQSPLSPNVSIESFFRSLRSTNNNDPSSVTVQAVMFNSAPVTSPSDSFGNGNTFPPEGTSLSENQADVHFQNLGPLSLNKGDRLQITVDRKQTEWKKQIVWKIPDNRDNRGRAISQEQQAEQRRYARTGSGYNGEEEEGALAEPFDVLSFKNPFDFPLTTAPVLISRTGRFLGQGTCYWTNPNEEASVRINKALSIRVSSKETERELDENNSNSSVSTNSPPLTFSDSSSDSSRIMPPAQKLSDRQIPLQTSYNQNTKTQNSVALRQPAEKQIGAQLGNKIADTKQEQNQNTARQSGSDLSFLKETVKIAGTVWRQALIDAEITVKNQRKEPAVMTIYRQFSGEIFRSEKIEGADHFNLTNLADQLNGVNKRHELKFDLTLAPGEARLIHFSYKVLIAL